MTKTLSDSISIKVEVSYLERQSLPDQDHYLFAYNITITNHGDEPAKLMTRHWQITNGDGEVNTVDGPGVVGKQPDIASGEQFAYTSSAVIETAVGTMHGHYTFCSQSGTVFDVPIPAFRLASPNTLH
ncbi:Co2+/Mg2+ efflux protein ApaG [Neiella marina]|uniref:Protein ApaG n=1 Tax=Neiella holothuriorum TaxID=2870530 RepID=A0ABS7EIY5_9GAMM|nr:Co2+/Mg2+ efflux protein ApaG [Neiella holothuriorum]MBW8192312.1 Co2+/Mg2+ efflux protein ApaG [Neiella holothuriorum]